MVRLSKTLINRMVGRRGGGSSSVGGSAGGGVSSAWVEDNYVSKDFFSSLFVARDANGGAIDPNNSGDAIVASIQAMVGLWTNEYLSALGLNSGGSGGAASLAGLVDVALTTPQTGQVLAYDGETGKWVNAAVPGGGGGTVTSVGLSVPTGFAVTGSPVTSSGTLAISFASGYALPSIADQMNWESAYQAMHSHANKSVLDDITSTDIDDWNTAAADAHTHNNLPLLDSITSTMVSHWQTAYGWGNHALAGYLTSVAFGDLTSHPTTLDGYGITDAYNKTEADGRFLTIEFFRSLFRAYTGSNIEIQPNSSATASITNIRAMVGLWTNEYLSALGLNSGGSGGAVSLSGLVDVALTTPQTGQVLAYDGETGKWVNANSGGGGTGSVTSVGLSVPTGFAVTGSPVTSSGTLAISFASGYALPAIADQQNWDSAFQAMHSHSNKLALDSITGTKIDEWDAAYAYMHTHANKSLLDSITSTMVSHWQTAYGWGDHAQAGYATETWVQQQGYLTQHQTVSGTFWGRSWTNGGTVSGNISSAGYIFMSGNLVMNATGASDSGRGLMIEGYANSGTEHRITMGLHEANSAGWVSSGITLQLVVDTSNTVAQRYVRAYDAIRIGDGMLTWDSTNGAFKVQKYNGTSAHLYATGSVSALGFSAGTSSVDAMTFNNLDVTNALTLKNGSLSNVVKLATNGKIQIGTTDGNGAFVYNGLTVYDGLSVSENGITMETGDDINMNGGSICFSANQSDRLYASNGHLYFNDTLII